MNFPAKSSPVAIVGGTGYGAGELLRLIALHPLLEVSSVVSRSRAGSPIATVHSHLQGINDGVFVEKVSIEALRAASRSAIFVAVPHGESIKVIRELQAQDLPAGAVIVDLSGDLRLRDEAVHAKHYGQVPFEEEMRSRFVYGLPEINRDSIRSAKLITNPGCLATAAALALRPAVATGFSGSVVVDAKTGTSGAGREPQASMHHPARYSDVTPYKVLEHRHEPEILQAIGDPRGTQIQLMFVPHLLPVSRGILVTCYLTAPTEAKALEIEDSYRVTYANERFVRLRQTPPRLVDIVGTNFCDLFVTTRGAQVVVIAALDNLGKGMAGQAIQNINLMFGIPEETGLLQGALGPV